MSGAAAGPRLSSHPVPGFCLPTAGKAQLAGVWGSPSAWGGGIGQRAQGPPQTKVMPGRGALCQQSPQVSEQAQQPTRWQCSDLHDRAPDTWEVRAGQGPVPGRWGGNRAQADSPLLQPLPFAWSFRLEGTLPIILPTPPQAQPVPGLSRVPLGSREPSRAVQGSRPHQRS